jgi:hypothetical protein
MVGILRDLRLFVLVSSWIAYPSDTNHFCGNQITAIRYCWMSWNESVWCSPYPLDARATCRQTICLVFQRTVLYFWNLSSVLWKPSFVLHLQTPYPNVDLSDWATCLALLASWRWLGGTYHGSLSCLRLYYMSLNQEAIY